MNAVVERAVAWRVAAAAGLAFGAMTGWAQAFPPTIDTGSIDLPLGTVIEGVDAGERSGSWVAGAGDLNGDRIGDLLIGAPLAAPGDRVDAGRAYVVFGVDGGLDGPIDPAALDGSNGFVIDGETAGDRLGSIARPAGDLDGDGFGDLVVGVERADPDGRTDAGRVYVVFGRAAGFPARLDPATLDGTHGFRIDGEQAFDRLGRSVAGVGDLDGDGVDDLAIGAPGADPNGSRSGRVYVIFGRPSFPALLNTGSLAPGEGLVVHGVAGGDEAGGAVAGAGDVNGDGVEDLVIGASEADVGANQAAGRSYVVFGAAEPASPIELASLDGSTGFRIDGEAFEDRTGIAVAGAGDVNGDGFDDVAIGTFGADGGAGFFSGRAYVVFGAAGGLDASLGLADLDGSNGFRVNGAAADDLLGLSIAGAGDVDGDGLDDLVIGAPRADVDDRNEAGGAYLLLGRAAPFPAAVEVVDLDGSNGFVLLGAERSDFTGISVDGVGDANGDGVADLLIGALLATVDGRDNAGRSYVVHGRITGTPLLDIDAPGLLDFGGVVVGTSSPPQVVALFNPGSGLVSIEAVGLSDPAFSIDGGSCGPLPIRIPVGGTCTLELGFAPSVESRVVAELVFSGTSATSPDSIALTGTGLPAPVVSLVPSPLDFGDVEPGDQTTALLIVENVGGGVLRPGAITLVGRSRDDYAITANGCAGAELASAAFCGIELRFEPQAPGLRHAQLVLDSNAPAGPAEVGLRGSSGLVFASGFEGR